MRQILQQFCTQILANVLQIHHRIGTHILSLDDSVPIDDEYQRDGRAHLRRQLGPFHKEAAIYDPERESRSVFLGELSQARRVITIIESQFDNLQATRLEFSLYATQNLSGVLAVRSRGQDRDQQHYLASVVGQQILAFSGHLKRNFARRTRNGCAERYQRERGKQYQFSNHVYFFCRAERAVDGGTIPLLRR